MIEEIKLLVEMITKLPNIAVWVLAGFLVYKISIIGSVYGLIRFIVDKTHNYFVTHKTKVQEITLEDRLHGMTITSDDTMKELILQLHRIAGKGTGIETRFIHRESVNWLRQAINDKIDKDNEKNIK